MKYLLIIASVLLLFACKKEEESNIGLNQINPLNAVFTDTITINATTEYGNTVVTSNAPFALLGSYSDNIFGSVKAEFLTQLNLSSNNVSWGTNIVADSAVIYLDYAPYYGDTLDEQTIKIYELTNDIDKSTTYYSNFDGSTYNSGSPIMTFNYTPKPLKDNVLRIKLPIGFAQKLISASPTDLANSTNFIKYFKGFYFTTEQEMSASAIMYFYLNSDNSSTKLTLYYTNSEGKKEYNFKIDDNCAKINAFKCNSENVALKNKIGVADLPNTFVQSMGGVRTKLTLPFIKNWEKEKYGIIKAQLIIPAETDENITGNTSIFSIPSRLNLIYLKEDGTEDVLEDSYYGSTYFGGTLSSNFYTFNITKYFQSLINEKITSKGLYISPYYSVSDITTYYPTHRVVINTNKHTTNKMKLLLTYTILE